MLHASFGDALPSMYRPSPEKIKRHLQRLQQSLPAALANRFIETDLMTQAASLAFYALLSLAPLLVLLLWLTASLYPSAQSELIRQVGELAGSGAETIADTVIDNARQRPSIGSLAGLWSTLLLFVGATAVFARLQAALNLIFRTDAQRLDGVVRVAAQARVLVRRGVRAGLPAAGVDDREHGAAGDVRQCGVAAAGVGRGHRAGRSIRFAFALLYHYLPDRRVQWRQAFLGGAITALLFTGGRYLIGLYIAQAAPGSAYGTMGTLVILLVWIYYATVVFFIGALLTAVIDERARAKATLRAADMPLPTPVADTPAS